MYVEAAKNIFRNSKEQKIENLTDMKTRKKEMGRGDAYAKRFKELRKLKGVPEAEIFR